MKKMNKYFLLMVTAFSLSFFACNNALVEPSEEKVSDDGFRCIKVCLGSTSAVQARTALPDFNSKNGGPADSDKANLYKGFTQFKLDGTRKGDNTKISKTWNQSVDQEGTVTKTAYEALVDDSIVPLAYYTGSLETGEEWTFVLTGYYGGTFDENGSINSDSFIEFSGEQEVRPKGNGTANTVSFELSRKSKYVYDENKKGSLSITLDCGTSSLVSTIRAQLFKPDGTQVSPASQGEYTSLVYNPSSHPKYVVENLPEGQYYAKFEFYDKDSHERDIYITSAKEYAYVIYNLTSTSELKVDPNGTFNISYLNDNSSGFNHFASSYKAPAKYSRLSDTTVLPVTSNFNSEDEYIQNHIFLGWYDENDSTFANRITQIEKGSRVGDLTLKARFIHKNEVPTVLGVKFTYDDGVTATADDGAHPLSELLKVGHKITATPYYNDGSSDKDFLGTIAKWEWYVGDDKVNDSEVTTTDISAEDENAATSSIILKPSYADKTITVKVVQKNTIEETSEGSGIFNVAENIVGGQVATGKTKETVAGTVAKGTLYVNSTDFKLYYNSGTAVETGSAINSTNISLTDVVKNNVYDDNNRTKSEWNLSGLQITPTLVFAEGAPTTAPNEETGSKYYDVVLKASGYNDLSLTGANGAFINVKFKTPTSAILPEVLWGTANHGTVDENQILDCINKGNVAFMSNKYSSYYNRPIYYGDKQTPTASNVAATMAAFDSACQVSSTDLKLGIKNNSVSAVDAKGNNVGYIADSDSYTPSLTGYVGTREKIASIAVINDKQVGKDLSLKICDAGGNQITQYSDINWTLKFGSTEYPSTGKTSTSHTINQADYIAEDGNFTATAVRNYPVLGNRTINLGSTSITKGSMSDKNFSYVGPAKKSGGEVTLDELTPKTFTSNTDANSGASITCSTSVTSTVSAEEGAATGSVKVTISASGYEPKTVDVTGIPIKANPPAVGGDSDMTYTDSQGNTITLKTNSLKEGEQLKTVSIGHVAFNDTLAPSYAYEFTRTYFESLKDYYESMTMNQLTAVYITKTAEDTRTQTLIDNIQQEFDRCHETGWHSIVADTNGDGSFEKPLASEYYSSSGGQSYFISLRSKMTGLLDGELGTRVYYDTGTNTWHTPSFTDLYTATEFSNDGTKCTVKDSEGHEHTVNIKQHASEVVNVLYDSDKNDGIRGIKNAIVTVEKADLRLSGTRNGEKVTFKLAEGLTKKFTITRWKVDGMSVANFKTAEGTTGVVEVLGSSGTEAKLEFTLSDLKDGTYQITAYGTDEYGIEHIGGASIVVSN